MSEYFITKTEVDAEQLVDRELLKKAFPKGMRVQNLDGLVESINEIICADEMMRDVLRENLVGFSNILKEGGYKATDYVNAVKFVSYKIMGRTVTDSWANTFPGRYQRLVDIGTNEKDISSHAGQYNKSKLVNKVFEQSLIPTHVLNADVYQKAINVQAQLMMTADSEKVRSDAANSLLTHLKAPETKKIELDIGIKDDKSIQDLRETIVKLGEAQKAAILAGTPVVEIAHSKLIDSDIVEGEIVDAE